jgi:hypothetical protein
VESGKWKVERGKRKEERRKREEEREKRKEQERGHTIMIPIPRHITLIIINEYNEFSNDQYD